MIGVIVGGSIGLHQATDVCVSGGASKLAIIGNAKGTVDGSNGNSGARGQAVVVTDNMAVYKQSTFFVTGGRVDLYAPGNYALVCGTNAVSAGKLNICADPGFGDFRTLFTVSGASLAAEAVAGTIAFGADLLFTDALLAQIFGSFWPATETILTADEAKPIVGISANGMFALGGQVNVTASETGILLGGTGNIKTGVLVLEHGSVSVASDGVAIADWKAAAGSATKTDSGFLIWMPGGRLSAKGGLDGILTCGGILMDGGTLEAAATGGRYAGTIPDDPGLAGYALNANNGFAIDGGSFVATAGALRTTPNTSSDHGWAAVHPCDLDVSGSSAGSPVVVSDIVPSWYGTSDLYPIEGILRLWLPAGEASLRYKGISYVANDNGSIAPGHNVFLPGWRLSPCVPVSGRFDGDGKSDIVLFAGGDWVIEAGSLGRSIVSFGSGDCIPVPADYDGDGATDLSVYDTVTGDWWILYSSGGWKQDNFGSLTCKPFPADYDGDGKADLSVWDGLTGDRFIRFSSGGWIKDNFGSLSCIPVPADYDGDGKADLSVRDNATGDWWTRYSRGLNGRSWSGDNFGSTVCDPYPADYDGDGLADLSVYDQQTGDWFVRFSSGGWTKDNFGMKTCIPVPADYDGDGRADFAVYDTATFTFWARYSGGGWTSTDF